MHIMSTHLLGTGLERRPGRLPCMARSWTHVGRCWTNGEPFLAMDAQLLPGWRGETDQAYERLVPRLGEELTSVPVGDGAAGLLLTDPAIGDEGWLEVFHADDDAVAVVQASADDYPAVLSAALDYPESDDQAGDVIDVPSGRLAFVSAALDGEGPQGAPLSPEDPGPLPTSAAYRPAVDDAGGPVVSVPPGPFRLSVRWSTEFYEDALFARWILTPAR